MTEGPDFLASLCLPAEGGPISRDIAAIAALARDCAARMRYFEILYVVDEGSRSAVDACAPQLAAIPNLRILFVRNNTSFYQRRTIAAGEAIGDVVAIGSFAELARVDLPALAADSFRTDQVLLAHRVGGPGVTLLYPLLRALSSHRVNGRDMRSIAFPRVRLVQALARESATIDLRFEPKRGECYVRVPVAHARTRQPRGHAHRLQLLAEIISGASSAYLRAYAVISLFAFLAAIAYGLYAIVVVTTFRHVQPGWFTTNLIQSGSIGFLALGFAIFALGLARLLEQRERGSTLGIVDEIGNINFFRSAPELNVEVGRGTTEAGVDLESPKASR
ncbi:MAG: hypothetical protein JWO81_207 [Alphaproteobacteria bacterium]|nr:hypothetical protein [Alphaproteobacteria bacterium]